MQEMQETQVQSLGREAPLEEEMAIHSSMTAWRVPWAEEPGGLQLTGKQSLTRRSDLSTHVVQTGFPGGPESKEPACNAGDAGDVGLIPGWGRSPGGGPNNRL